MSPSTRWILPLCLASFLWAIGFGASAPLSSLWLEDLGVRDTLVGLNTGTYYLGIVLAAGLVPWLVGRWGYGCVLFAMVGSGLTAAFFPWCDNLPGWFALRGLNGVASALCLIPLEAFVNRQSSPDRRAQNFGCYAFCIALGMALGTSAAMAMHACYALTAFVLSGVAPLLGAAIILCWRPALLPTTPNRPIRASYPFFRNFLSFGSTWSQGFLEGGMVGLLPLYLLSNGISEITASWLLGSLMVGVIFAQLPVAWLADRLGHVRVLVACNVLTLLGLGLLMLEIGFAWLAICLFLVGACSGAFYPLGLALLGDRVPESAMARTNARYLAVNSLGSLAGPAIAGAAMDGFGRGALFVAGAAAVGVMFATGICLEFGLGTSRATPAERGAQTGVEASRVAA
jgi:MFS family permease